MNRGTQLIIGAVIAVLGVGMAALGLVDQESRVTYVQDVVAQPEAFMDGQWTLLGIPEVAALPTGDPSPDYRNQTTWVIAWHADRIDHHSIHTARLDDGPGPATWTVTNTTRVAGQPGTASAPIVTTWSTPGENVFLIRPFEDQGQAVWAVYDDGLRDPLLPKPSQFKGRLDPTAPAGLHVYRVDELTVGCSSKFLPEDVAAEYDKDGDGRTD